MSREKYDTFGTLEREFWTCVATVVIEEFGKDLTIDEVMDIFKITFARYHVPSINYKAEPDK